MDSLCAVAREVALPLSDALADNHGKQRMMLQLAEHEQNWRAGQATQYGVSPASWLDEEDEDELGQTDV
jgi:hypothetical protein